MWGDRFMFTRLWRGPNKEKHVGWQVTCKLDGHESCRKSANFGRYGGEEMTERRLKQWCVLGHTARAQGKREHFEVANCHFNDDPPDLTTLDEVMRSIPPKD